MRAIVLVFVSAALGCAGPWMPVERVQAPRYLVPQGSHVAVVQISAQPGGGDSLCRKVQTPDVIAHDAFAALELAFAQSGLVLVDRTREGHVVVRFEGAEVRRVGELPPVPEPLILWIYAPRWPCPLRDVQDLQLSIGMVTRDGREVDTQRIEGRIDTRGTTRDIISFVPDRPPPYHQTTRTSAMEEQAGDAPHPYLWRSELASDTNILDYAQPKNAKLLVVQAMERYAAAFSPTIARYSAMYEESPGAKRGLEELRARYPDRAMRAWQTAALLDPGDHAVLFDMAQLLVVLGHDRAALRYVEAALAKSSNTKYQVLRREILDRLAQQQVVSLPPT